MAAGKGRAAVQDRQRLPDWINEGEKFALIGLPVKITPDLGRVNLPGELTVLPNADFELPDHWRAWLGTLRVEDVADCSLFLLAKATSGSLSVLNDENRRLSRLVGDWFTGLTLANKFETLGSIFIATGSRHRNQIDVRQFGPINPPRSSVVWSNQPISLDHLKRAAAIANGLSAIKAPGTTINWRLLRCLRIYQDARTEHDILERIHQFTRCIEGLIVPEQGKTKKQFKSRTEMFIGPGHHDLMGDLYDIRSDVEHLNENQNLEKFDRETRIALAKLEAVSEWVARSCLERILLNPTLIGHFGNVTSAVHFWKIDEAERKRIWGDPVDPRAPLANFNFDYVSDQELGANE